MADLLIELYSEEIPARMQKRAADDLKRLMTNGLVEAGLTYRDAGSLVTPRRLVLVVEGLSEASQARLEERRGPKTSAPDKAVDGFCASVGLSRDQLEIREDKKGSVYYATIRHEGRVANEIVSEVLSETIHNFPWPKSMRWGAGSLRWVRPLRRIIAILHDESGHSQVALDIEGVEQGDATPGHPVLAPALKQVSSFESYQEALAGSHVILDPAQRAAKIRHDTEQAAFASGLRLVVDEALLAEIAGLVEWPHVLIGRIEERFLHLPAEVLQVSMRVHQKFLSLEDPQSGAIKGFVVVADMVPEGEGAEVLNGNGRVLAARLSDAVFFWDNDLRQLRENGMNGWREAMETVTFHTKLGSEADRIERIAALAEVLAPMMGQDKRVARQAAEIAKADLVSEMVYEFPELQGIMGSYYAKEAGMPPEIAAVPREHYRPQGPSDAIPSDGLSQLVAVSEKLDKLAGFWAIDEKPTGSKDPFALRRAALGVIRIIVEGGHRLKLRDALTTAMDPYSGTAAHSDAVLSFVHERMKVWLKDAQIGHDVIDAALDQGSDDDLWLVHARAAALATFLRSEDGTNLAQGFRRANNILTQAEAEDGVEYSFGADAKFLDSEAETALFKALESANSVLRDDMFESAEGLGQVMATLASLREPLDAFFDTVQVNADSAVVRRNRLNLLSQFRALCLRIANLTKLEG